MASDSELDRNAILEKFASIKRMHDEVGKKQTEDYQKRLQKLKEDETNYMSKLVSQPAPEDLSNRNLTSARRDLFLTSKTDFDHSLSQPYKPPIRHHDSHENNEHEWNIDDDFQPLNITDTDVHEERLPTRYTNDEEAEENYLSAYHQLLQTHHQQQQLMSQQDQENMLSTIFEASCEEATPMTSLLDVHQHRTQGSPTPVNQPMVHEEEDEVFEEEEYELTTRVTYETIDEIPVSTVFSKNENLKYSEYIVQKLQTEKDEQAAESVKEKRPFLRKRQGLAHYQAPPKRRQSTGEHSQSKNEDRHLPTARSETNKRSSTRSRSSSSTVKPKPPASKPVTQSNLLGKVDLDDEDDLLSKFPAKQNETHEEFTSSMKKFNSNIQTMIDTKWSAYKSSFHEEEEEEEEEFYPRSRQRTSSQTQAKKGEARLSSGDLDEFETLEQYAEEHPSMISTASYVEKVVLKETKPADGEPSTNRIRQRKIFPLKNKIEPLPPPPASSNSDEEEEEEDRWDDVAVAKVIPIVADEYNSDSGISSFKTQPKKDSARSSDFGDEQSWTDRPLNSLMLNTFPALRPTAPAPAPLPPPPPHAPEPSHDYSRLVREKAKELEKQIELFEKENSKLQSLCNERNTAIRKLKQDREEFEKQKQKELEEFQQTKEEETRKLRQERRLFEQHQKQLREHPDKREREEIELFKKQIATLQEDLKQRETRWSTTVNRLKERIETLEYENAEIKQEKDIIERKRLELMHQLQTTNRVHAQEETISTRKSLVELQQTKARPKAVVSSTTKTQSLPKTAVIRNSEPPSKPKVTTNGRKTPTSTIGVNGIKNNIDATRKMNSLPATKRSTSITELNEFQQPPPPPPQIRVDSGNGGSDEEIPRTDHHLSSLTNTDYPRMEEETDNEMNLDYKSLLNMASRTSTSATTLLKHHQQTLALLDQTTTTTTRSIAFKENLPLKSPREDVRHNDGRVERIKPDHSKEILFPNGSKQEISADGKHIRVHFYNGDFKEKHPDGRCIYKYANTNTTEVEYPDGTRVCEFPNGQIEKHLPDGKQEHILPDKTKNIYLTDGTIISIKPNGEKFIQHPNQTKEIHTDTFKRKLFPNGSILTVFNTGEQEIRYANGKIKIKDQHGNIILEKKESIK